MARMVRKQIYIRKAQDEELKRAAGLLDRSESDLIRQGIDSVTSSALAQTRRKRALDELLAAWELRGELDIPLGRRSWTREELYEDRFQRSR
jgi:hypothetical protein